MLSFQDIIDRLNRFWASQGCAILQPWDQEVGAGTFHPATFLGALGPQPSRVAYVQASRRPTDGRYGENPNRGQRYYQYQVIIKPSLLNIQELYLTSLEALGIDTKQHEVRFVEDDWKSPALGAWGIGWEVWLNGMEISQFTYFQQVGGVKCKPTTVEITYGLERLAMYIQKTTNMYDLKWNDKLTYGALFQQYEAQMSSFNFTKSDPKMLLAEFEAWQQQCDRLLKDKLFYPAYESAIKCSHLFNLLDARGALSVSQRQEYLLTVRKMTSAVAETYLKTLEVTDQLEPKTHKELASPLTAETKVKHAFSDLLLELGTGELPPDQVADLAKQLAQNLLNKLLEAGLGSAAIVEHFYTPRRIAVRITKIATKQPAKEQLLRGPALVAAYDTSHQPTLAAIKFAESNGASPKDFITVKDDKGHSFVAIKRVVKGDLAANLLPKLIQDSISALNFKRGMYWGDNLGPFVRPLNWLVAIFDSKVLPLNLWGVTASNKTYGLRTKQAKPLAVTPTNYLTVLYKAKVLADPKERQNSIETQLKKIPGVKLDQALLEQIVNLVEWPVVLEGSFSKAFLSLPREVIETTLKHHQRCFVVTKPRSSDLTNKFVLVANQDSSDPKVMVHGQEIVVTARLTDASYFYKLDNKADLIKWLEALASRQFFEGLGSLKDKTQRNVKLTAWLSTTLKLTEADSVASVEAAKYAKVDLMSQMVNEFPELQGIMGGYYTEKSLPKAAATAIKEQYLPRFTGDMVPSSAVSIVLALSDRLDTLTSLFSINKQPTGDKDPLALRRLATSLIRIIVENKLNLNLNQAFAAALKIIRPDANKEFSLELISKLWQFMLDRVPSYLKLSLPVIKACVSAANFNLTSLKERAKALEVFMQQPSAKLLLQAFKRVDNLLAKANLSSESAEAKISPVNTYEKALHAKLKQLASSDFKDYAAALNNLVTLAEPLDAFLTNVKVIDLDDASGTKQRLQLLNEVNKLVTSVADFNYLLSGQG